MAMFRKKSTEHPVMAFWDWWARTGATAVENALENQKPLSIAAPLTERLARVHPDLVWETSKGESSRHRLTVSSNGLAELRPLAERWRRAAPSETPAWEYRSSKEGSADQVVDQVLEIHGHRLRLGDSLFGVDIDERQQRVNVTVSHPMFPAMPEDARRTVAFLLLDWIVGEDRVERWVGSISAVVPMPSPGATARELAAAVDSLASANDPEQWTLGRGRDENGVPLLAMMRRGVRWIDAPALDLHNIIELAYQADGHGLPSPEELDRLRADEDRVTASVGPSVLLVGHVSSAGRRTFHYYSDSEDQNVTESLRAAAASVGGTHSYHLDPAWRDVRQLTG